MAGWDVMLKTNHYSKTSKKEYFTPYKTLLLSYLNCTSGQRVGYKCMRNSIEQYLENDVYSLLNSLEHFLEL